jgi:hypothetical protein
VRPIERVVFSFFLLPFLLLEELLNLHPHFQSRKPVAQNPKGLVLRLMTVCPPAPESSFVGVLDIGELHFIRLAPPISSISSSMICLTRDFACSSPALNPAFLGP